MNDKIWPPPPTDERVPSRPVPVLEVGGTHVTAALVDPTARAVLGEPVRKSLPAGGTAEQILDRIAATAAHIKSPRRAVWGVAMPGPFDYQAGIGLFRDVGKFDALYGVNVSAELKRRLQPAPAGLRFLNDANAFGLGEVAAGAAVGYARVVCITLGSGVGSAFLREGVPINHGPLVPPGGSVHLLTHGGRPLEETVSRRGIRAAYARAAIDETGLVPDVAAIAELVRDGDRPARAVLDHAFRALGATLAPWLARFEAQVLVVGGSIAASWDLIEEPLTAGIDDGPDTGLSRKLALRPAGCPHDAPLFGAAWWAVRPQRASAGEPLTAT